MKPVVHREFFVGNARPPDLELGRPFVQSLVSPLAAIGFEMSRVHTERLTCGAGRALGPKPRPTESSPPGQQTLFVFSSRRFGHEFVLQLPGAISQVTARTRRSHECREG